MITTSMLNPLARQRAEAEAAGRQRKAPEPLPGAPKTWKHAAEALADLGRAW